MLQQTKQIHAQVSKIQYRSQIEIMADILSATSQRGREGILVSHLSRKANVSHYDTIKKLNVLTKAGLVEIVESKSQRAFKLTERGIEFLQEIQLFHSKIKDLNLV